MGVERTEHGALGAARRFGMVNGVDEQGEAEDVGQEDEFLQIVKHILRARFQYLTYLPHIATYLARRSEELYSRHPLLSAQPGFARKIVEVDHQTFEDILEPRIRIGRVDQIDVVGDVVNGEIQQWRDLADDLRGVHDDRPPVATAAAIGGRGRQRGRERRRQSFGQVLLCSTTFRERSVCGEVLERLWGREIKREGDCMLTGSTLTRSHLADQNDSQPA